MTPQDTKMQQAPPTQERKASPNGDRLVFPDGTVYVITEPADRTGGERFEMEMLLVSGGDTPPPHVHPHQSEHWEVLEGSFDVQIAGTWRTLTAGQTAAVEPGGTHHFRNTSGAVTRVRTTFRPALSFEDFIARVHRLIASGQLRGPQDPKSLLYLSMLFREHRDTVGAAGAPQRVAMAAASLLGRLLRLQLPPRTRRLTGGGTDGRCHGSTSPGTPAFIAWPALAATTVVALAASGAAVLGLRELGHALLDVPDHLAPLSTSALIAATVLPVIGSSFGFLMSFSVKPGRHSMHIFLAFGAVMTLAGTALALTQLPGSAGAGTIVTTLAVALTPVIVIVSALLMLLRGTARHEIATDET